MKHNRVIQLILPPIIALAGISASVVAQPVDDRTAKQQTGLSGTYEGVITFPERGLYGRAALKISGDRLSLESRKLGTEGQGITLTGRISIVTTRTYTAVALQVNGAVAPTVISLRARRNNGGLILQSAPGEKLYFSFVTDDMIHDHYDLYDRRFLRFRRRSLRSHRHYRSETRVYRLIIPKRVPGGESRILFSELKLGSKKGPRARHRGGGTRVKRRRH